MVQPNTRRAVTEATMATALTGYALSGAYTDARKFGVSITSTADQRAVIQSALDSGEEIFLPPHATDGYRINGALDMTAGGRKLHGGGPGVRTRIRQLDKTQPIIKVGMDWNQLSGLRLMYDPTITASDNAANAIEFYRCMQSDFRNIDIYNCSRGFFIPQVDVGGAGNSQWSNTFRTISIAGYWKRAIDLTAFNSGMTPSTWINVYTYGRDDNDAWIEHDYIVYLDNDDGQVFINLNIEWTQWSAAGILVKGSNAAVFEGLHFEQCKSNVLDGGFVQAGGASNASFEGVSLRYNTILKNANIFLLTSTARIAVNNLLESSTTITSGTFRLLSNLAERNGFTRSNVCRLALATDNGPAEETTGVGAPVLAGRIGDRYWRSDGTTGSFLYRCTTAGVAAAAVWTATAL